MGITCGFFIGVIVGWILCCIGESALRQKAIKNGYMEHKGVCYKITKLEK